MGYNDNGSWFVSSSACKAMVFSAARCMGTPNYSQSRLARYPSSVPVACVCPPPPPDVLGPVEIPACPAAALGLTALTTEEPGLTPRSLKKILQLCPVGLGAPHRPHAYHHHHCHRPPSRLARAQPPAARRSVQKLSPLHRRTLSKRP